MEKWFDMCTYLLLYRLILSRTQVDPALFFRYNTALGPPYQVLIDTNFINFAVKNKLDIVRALMDCLLAKCMESLRCNPIDFGRYSVCDGLCHGRVGEIGTQVSYRTPVCERGPNRAVFDRHCGAGWQKTRE